MTSRPDFSLIVPRYGHADLTARLLDELADHETASYEVLVVDDGSPDSSHGVAGLLGRASHVTSPRERFLFQPHRGVTAAWNFGARSAEGESLVFLNNDVRVSGPFLDELGRGLDRAATSLVGVRWREEHAVPAKVATDLPRRLLEGWCFAVRKATWSELEGFDESLGLYFSDTDFQWRLLRQFPESQLLRIDLSSLAHIGHLSTRCHPACLALWRRDRRTFVEKWS